MKLSRKVRIVLGGIIAVVLIAPPVTYLIWQMQARRAVEQFASDATELAVEAGSDAVINEAQPATPLPHASGTLSIPQHGIEMPIYGGSNAGVLYSGAWRFPGTADPGQPGNAVLFGHRFLKLPPSKNTMFRLGEVEVGETFTVQWGEEQLTYRIVDRSVVAPDQLEIPLVEEKSVLTLITCNPVFSTRERLVIRAVLEE